jgi:hypothetical protein
MKNEIATTWIQIAIMTGRTINQTTMELMLEAVADLPQENVLMALKNWAKNESTFPLPASIRQKIVPVIDDKEIAIDAVNRIIAAVSKYGWTNKHLAKDYIGELGWETTERFGGWVHLCENLNQNNEGMLRAQLRELAVVVNKKSMLGELDERPKLKTIAGDGGAIFKLPEMKGF